MLTCLENIIGVTNSTCDCIVNGLTDEEKTALAVTTSGLLLDNLEGGVHMKALSRIDSCKTFKEMATSAIADAVKRLEDDLIVALNNKYSKSKKTYKGTIGRMSYSKSLAVSRKYQGIRIKPVEYSDGVITLNKITAIINKTATFHVQIYRVITGAVMGELVEGQPGGGYEMVCTANNYFSLTLSTALKLPLVVDGNAVEYWFVYDRTEDVEAGDFQPKDTKLACATCEQSSTNALNDFLTAWGVEFNSLTGLTDKIEDSFSHGLILDLSVKCENEALFCREYAANDAIAVTMAYSTWYKAGELLIERVMATPDINRYTTMNKEYLWGKRNHFRKEYETRIMYMAQVIDVSDSNCYVCREVVNQPFMAGIMK